ncbi:MAG: glycosyltransferase family 39 protein [Planctomycetia bacterium]|nr:glycosyltransferase family 39 protein [Planctomycetia bacterium]
MPQAPEKAQPADPMSQEALTRVELSPKVRETLLRRTSSEPYKVASPPINSRITTRRTSQIKKRRRLPIPPRQAMVLAGLIIAAALFGTYAMMKWWELRREPLRPYSEMKGAWIQATSPNGMDVYTGLFRRDFRLAGHVRNAWIAVAACDGFEVTVNGRAIGWQQMWRPTRPYQTSLSERGQWISWPKVAMSLNYAREYQWTDHQSFALPVFIDLTPYLHAGANVIGLEVESRKAPAKVRFDGAVTLFNGQVISLASDTEWRAEVNAPDQQDVDWWSPEYRTLAWRHAALSEAPSGEPLRAFNPRIYSTAFAGQWLRHPLANAQQSVWFQYEVRLDRVPDEAWMRLATNRNFELFVNGKRGYPETPDDRGLEMGEWTYGNKRTGDQWLDPEQMYSHDVGDEFVARQYRGAPKEPPGVDKNRFKSIAKTPTHSIRPDDASWALEMQKPLMTHHDRAVGAFVAYNLAELLHAGVNTIELRLNRPATSDPANWPGQIAVDGEATFRDGASLALFADNACKTRMLEAAGGADQPLVDAQQAGPALQADQALTKLQYRGAPAQLEFLPAWCGAAVVTTGGGLCMFAGVLAVGSWWPGRRGSFGASQLKSLQKASLAEGLSGIAFDALLAFTCVLAAVVVLQTTFGERSEQLWFFMPKLWLWSIVAAVALGVLAGGVRVLRLVGGTRLRAIFVGLACTIYELPKTRAWTFALIWLCVLTFFLRAYKLDFQPLDYDENPSLHAILSVSRTGIPSYVPAAVWYTRSPLYHYITGAVVRVFGENLWAARMPTVAFSIATAMLMYFCGSRLLKRPWVGMAAFVLTLIHPQMFMTGHMIRFYQQQQFFALLTAYWFCKGFVTQQSQRYRYLTVAAFLAATLSQEITAVMAVPLSVGYLFFAGKKTIPENIKLIIAAVCALAIIIVDYAVYETHTMTRLEGFSTTMQADIGPHLWEPYNFLTIFLSYSRIHLPLSLMFLLGLPAALRERNRVVLALHLLFFGNILMLNLMVTQVSVRYVYWLFPLLMVLAIDNARAGLAWLDEIMHQWGRRRAEARFNTPMRPAGRTAPDVSRLTFASFACFGILFAGTLVSWSPWRLPGSFSTKLLADSNGAFQYIRSQLRPGDLIVVTQPHAKGALMEIGRVDYEMHIPLVYDFVLRQNGRLVERGAGAGVIYSVEQFQKLCAEHGRVWVAIDREQFPFRGEQIRFSHTGARMELFLRRNTQIMHRTHLWNVYLWDANRGVYRTFRDSPT